MRDKYYYTHRKLFKKVVNQPEGSKRHIKVWYRQSTIQEEFLDTNFLVYNGKQFVAVRIIPEMIGHKLGEFSQTRKLCIFKKNSQKKKK